MALLRVWFVWEPGIAIAGPQVPLKAGLCGGANDIEYDPKTMDLLTPAGFACPAFHTVAMRKGGPRSQLHWKLRLAILQILKSVPGSLHVYALCCNSFTAMSMP